MIYNFITESASSLKQLDCLKEYLDGHNGYIAGGVFKDILQDRKPKDIDIFFKTEQDYHDADEYYKNNTTYHECYKNSKAKTYRNKENGILLDLVKFDFMEPLELLKTFDFTITQFAYFKDDKNPEKYKIQYFRYFFRDLHRKCIMLEDEIRYPLSTFQRMIRYISYGYKPCLKTQIKIIKSLQKIKDVDISYLEDKMY